MKYLLPVVWVCYIFWVTLAPPFDYDIWYDIRMGDEILASGSVPHYVSFLGSQEQFGAKYSPNDEWLYCVFTSLLWKAGGMTGLSVAMAVNLAALFGVLWYSCRRVGLPAWACVLWLGLGERLMSSRFMLRPQLATGLLLAILVAWLLRAETGNRRGLPWLMLPYFIFWANLHSAFLAGIAVLGAWWLLEIPRPVVPPRLVFACLCLGSISPLFTPGNWRLFEYVYHHFLTRTRDVMLVAEWQPLGWDWLRGPGGVFVLAVLVGFGLALREKRLRLPHLGLTLFFLWQARSHNRALGELVAVTMPLVAAAWAPRLRPSRLLEGVLAVWLVGAMALQPLNLKPPEAWPEKALPYLQQVQGTVFNSYHFGGWLTWKHVLPFVHGMQPVYPSQLLSDFLAILSDPARSPELLRQYKIQAILLHYPAFNDIHTQFMQRLVKDPAWSLVYWDDLCVLYLPSPQKGAYVAVSPALPDPFVGDLEVAQAELARKLAEDPSCTVAWRLQAQLLIKRGKVDEGLEAYRAMAARFPKDARAPLGLGAALFQLGRLPEAETALRQAAALDPRSATAHYNLALVLTARLRAAAQANDNATAQALLGQARDEAARAVSLDPNLAPAAELLRQLTN